MKKKILLFFMLSIILTSLMACTNPEDLTNEIKVLQEEGIPDEETVNGLLKKYERLSEEDKQLVKNYNVLKIYKNADFNALEEVYDAIHHIDNNSSFENVIEAEKLYNNLETDEKKAITNYDKLEKVKELTNVEKAAVRAVEYVRDSLKDSSSLELIDVTVKDELARMKFYFVVIKYSATNSFGGRVENAACLSINSDFQDPFYPLAVLSGKVKEYIEGTNSYLEYIKSDQPEIVIDCDKIMYYLK